MIARLFEVACKMKQKSLAMHALLWDTIRLRGLVTVYANQSTLSGIDAPIAGTRDGPR